MPPLYVITHHEKEEGNAVSWQVIKVYHTEQNKCSGGGMLFSPRAVCLSLEIPCRRLGTFCFYENNLLTIPYQSNRSVYSGLASPLCFLNSIWAAIQEPDSAPTDQALSVTSVEEEGGGGTPTQPISLLPSRAAVKRSPAPGPNHAFVFSAYHFVAKLFLDYSVFSRRTVDECKK